MIYALYSSISMLYTRIKIDISMIIIYAEPVDQSIAASKSISQSAVTEKTADSKMTLLDINGLSISDPAHTEKTVTWSYQLTFIHLHWTSSRLDPSTEKVIEAIYPIQSVVAHVDCIFPDKWFYQNFRQPAVQKRTRYNRHRFTDKWTKKHPPGFSFI